MILSRELRLAGVVVAIVALGLLVETTGDPVSAPPARSRSAGNFVERSTFCPPIPSWDGAAISVVGAASLEEETSVSIENTGETQDLASGQTVGVESTDSGLTLVGFGAPFTAGAAGDFAGPSEGSAGARCPSSTSDTWYFPFGTSDLGYDERLLFYNPFPDEAVARVTFSNTAGERAKAALDDVAVPAGEVTEVKVNDFIGTQPFLAARVDAVRGRFVAWRLISHKPDDGPRGTSMTLGASRAADTWYFAEGVLGSGGSQAFAIINPTDEEAIVNVSLVTGDKVIAPPQDLTEIKIARRTAESVSLGSIPGLSDKELAHASAIVSSINGVEIVVERRISSQTGDLEGVSTEVGSFVTARAWMVSPPVPDPTTDTISILNPTAERASVEIVLRSPDGTRRPKSLASLPIKPGLRIQVPIAQYASGGPKVALVRSDRPIVVERSGRSAADIGDVMGTPVDEDLLLDAGASAEN